MNKDTFQIALEGPGISIERNIPQAIAEQVALLVLTGSTGQVQSSEPVSLHEFLLECRAKRNPERFVAIAYFLKKYRKKNSFDKNDFVDGFEEAGEPFPANFGRDFSSVKEAGWIAIKTGRPGTFYLTQSGHAVVEAKFPATIRRKSQEAIRPRHENCTSAAAPVNKVRN